ncbi:MalM family protein [Vibrio crassostreae]|uniref:MalM family protein n=1 Tax=Vibrio crassostreae TaxID=246167 RepID=UPI0020213CD1|nr:MalM family protein [Vibrio crassostreae]
MKYLAILPAVFALSACSTVTESPIIYHKTSPGLESLQNNENCCETLSNIQYQNIANPQETFVSITTASPKVEFKSGRSFAEGIKLPTTLDAIRFSLTSNAGYSAFVPSLLVLDQNYQPLDIIGNESIKYQPLSLLDGAQYGAQIKLQERYLNGEAPSQPAKHSQKQLPSKNQVIWQCVLVISKQTLLTIRTTQSPTLRSEKSPLILNSQQ